MDDDDPRRARATGSPWRRPPVEERADQARTWLEFPVATLRHAALRALAENWERAAGHEGLRPPTRTAFRPTDVVEALGRITVLERTEPISGGGHSWRFRLVGTEIATIVQDDFTGQTIERFHAPLTAMLRAQIERAVAAGEPVAFAISTVVDNRPFAYEKIVLPVRSASGVEVDQVVTASFPAGGS